MRQREPADAVIEKLKHTRDNVRVSFGMIRQKRRNMPQKSTRDCYMSDAAKRAASCRTSANAALVYTFSKASRTESDIEQPQSGCTADGTGVNLLKGLRYLRRWRACDSY